MKSRLLNELAMLASDRFQERYIVNGTKEEYALPDEILDAALSSARNVVLPSSTASTFSPTETVALQEFVADASKALSGIDFKDVKLSNKQLIEEHQQWAVARLAARRVLAALAFDLGEWERNRALR